MDSLQNAPQFRPALVVLCRCGVYTKSSIMLGLGETDEEIEEAMLDLRDSGVDILTLGQYLQPTPLHLEVTDFVPPEKFEHWRKFGEEVVGFRWACVGAGSGDQDVVLGVIVARGLRSAG
jgi:lipoate synthase